KQPLSSFSMWWGRCSLVAFDFWDCAGAFARRAFTPLPVAHHCWTNLPQFSMGYSPPRDWFFVDLSGALATLAKGVDVVGRTIGSAYRTSGITSGFVFAQISSVQTDADVGRGEADQRRRFLGLGESLISLERAHGA